jgi:hypothetical protein
MRVVECVAYKDSVLIVLENDFFTKYHTSDSIDGGRYFVAIKLTDVLVPFGAESIALILMES